MKNKWLIPMGLFFASCQAFAEEAASGASSEAKLYIAVGAGLAIGLAAMGGALGQGKIGGAAMDGIARNPQAQKTMFVPMILGLVLIESLVIYALVIAFMLVGKL
jgi:F-type H+-transporting ATPase subunit c